MGDVIDFNSNNIIYNMALKAFTNNKSVMQKKILNYTNKKEFGIDFIYNLADTDEFLYELETLICNKEFLKNISFYYMALTNYGNYSVKNNGICGCIDQDFFININVDKGSIKYSCRNFDNYEKGYLKFFDNKYFINYRNGNCNKMISLKGIKSLHNDSNNSMSFFFNYDNEKISKKSIEKESNYYYENNKKEYISSSNDTNVLDIKRFNKVKNLVLYNHIKKYLNSDSLDLVNKNNYYYGYDFDDNFDVSKIRFIETDNIFYKTLIKRK